MIVSLLMSCLVYSTRMCIHSCLNICKYNQKRVHTETYSLDMFLYALLFGYIYKNSSDCGVYKLTIFPSITDSLQFESLISSLTHDDMIIAVIHDEGSNRFVFKAFKI